MDERPPAPDPRPCPGPGAVAGEPDPGPCPDQVQIPPAWHAYGQHLRAGVAGTWFPGELRCARCAAAHKALAVRPIQARMRQEAGLPHRFAGFRFDRFERQGPAEDWPEFRARLDLHPEPTLGITKWNATAARTCRDWRPRREADGTSLLLVGPVGGGKTTLAAALANGMIERAAALEFDRRGHENQPVPVLYMAETELYERLAMERANRTGRRYLELLARAPVLVLDDLGTTETLAPWHRDAIEHLVGMRYNDARPLVITSNLRLDGEPNEVTIGSLYGERVRSRLVDMLGGRRRGMPGYLELLGVDWRTDTRHVGEARPLPAEPAAQVALPGMAPRPAPEPRPSRPPRDHAMRQANDGHDHDDDSEP